MILIDSSVWIDAFRGIETRQVAMLRNLIRDGGLATGDLILAELLQGCDTDREFAAVHRALTAVPVIDIAGEEVAIAAARHYRALRARGVTVRKTIDTLIATRCILDGLALLYSDRDFDPFVAHCGLRSASDAPLGDR